MIQGAKVWEAKLAGADGNGKTFRLSLGKRKTERAIWKLIDKVQRELEWPYGKGTGAVTVYCDGDLIMHVAI